MQIGKQFLQIDNKKNKKIKKKLFFYNFSKFSPKLFARIKTKNQKFQTVFFRHQENFQNNFFKVVRIMTEKALIRYITQPSPMIICGS